LHYHFCKNPGFIVRLTEWIEGHFDTSRLAGKLEVMGKISEKTTGILIGAMDAIWPKNRLLTVLKKLVKVLLDLGFGWQHVSSAGFPTPTSLASVARPSVF